MNELIDLTTEPPLVGESRRDGESDTESDGVSVIVVVDDSEIDDNEQEEEEEEEEEENPVLEAIFNEMQALCAEEEAKASSEGPADPADPVKDRQDPAAHDRQDPASPA